MARFFKPAQNGSSNQKCNVMGRPEFFFFPSNSTHLSPSKYILFQKYYKNNLKMVQEAWLCVTITLRTTHRFCSSLCFESIKHSEEGRGVFRQNSY